VNNDIGLHVIQHQGIGDIAHNEFKIRVRFRKFNVSQKSIVKIIYSDDRMTSLKQSFGKI